MTITLIRHAQVEKKYQGRYNGHIDIALSKEGVASAKKLAKELQAENFDKVYCSDLQRARETLEAFALKLPTIYSQELREKSWGIHEGKSFEEIQAMGIKYKNFEQWVNDLDGEDAELYKERIKNYFYEVIAKDKADNILVVTHAGVIKTFLSIIRNLSLDEAFSMKLEYTDYIKLNIN